jgi:hypothetical protein
MSLNSDQREKVNMFKMVTGIEDTVAISFLERSNWDPDQALDTFFAEGNSGQFDIPEVTDTSNIEVLFLKYKETHGNHIEGDGI